ncbi:MAG: BlaI/MecI/CopY family transcriptional regulator [Patescibacteria group bacterium]
MKTKAAGELEMNVMNIVWEKGDCSVNTILENIGQDKKLAYTTVATILQRLYDKGIVNRKQNNGHYLYFANVTKFDYSKKLITNFFNHITSTFGDIAISSFAESIDHLPKNKRKELLGLLEEYENK